MSIGTVMQEVEQPGIRKIQHQTWGHLFPEDQVEPVTGLIRVAKGAYGDVILLDHTIPFPNSPWFFASLMEFASGIAERMEDGEVWEVFTEAKVVTNIEEIPAMWEYCLDGVQVNDLEPVKYVQEIKLQNCGGNLMLGVLK